MNPAERVKTFSLDNGMKFIVMEDHSIPNACLRMFWRTGSRNESPGLTGLSHFCEHMMFNGAGRYGPGMFDRTMESAGGSNNAYTSEDVTVYVDSFPSGELDLMFELEADRMGSLALDPKMFESERDVILAERAASMENSLWSLLDEHVRTAAFMAQTYRWPVLGFESDIRGLTRGDLKTYFESHYVPGNCVAVLVGDVEFEAAKKLAQKHFGPMPAKSPPPPPRAREPAQAGERRVSVHRDVSSPCVMAAFHAPEAASPDHCAMLLLAFVLGEGRSSRLHTALVDETRTAMEVYAYYPVSLDPCLFRIFAVCSAQSDEKALEAAMLAVLDRTAREGVTDQELSKARNGLVVAFHLEMETLDGRAEALGSNEVFFGDWKRAFDAAGIIAKAGPEDVKKVAAAVLARRNMTVGVLTRGDGR